MNARRKRICRPVAAIHAAGRLGATVMVIACASASSVVSAAAQTPRAAQRIALVTGSTSALGQEVARRLAS
ncbi:MAG: hypothetical protein HY701_00370, partial [Gemmatimonadetes bacterium]|nr:hypothetical protein [Gemmatimonadota bacterium]